MLSRRALIVAGGATSLSACTGQDAYAQAAAETWQLRSVGAVFPARALIHAATLAANSHNTQPWRFQVQGSQIRILPDLSRRTPNVDPDDHHLFVSLGCAAETMLQAGLGYGWIGACDAADPRNGLTLDFAQGRALPGSMFRAIPRRASTRAEYDGRAVPATNLRDLEVASGTGTEMSLITDPKRLGQATDFIVTGNTAQVRDNGFRRELKSWIRFDQSEALAHRDGLFAGSSGSPTLPRVIGERLFDLAFTEKGETDKIVRQMRSSAGLAIFTSPRESLEDWVEAGRAFTRFALTATAIGLKLAFLNQPVENVPARAAFASWLGVAPRRPDLVVRFGWGPSLPRSLRRSVAQVMAK